MFPRFCNMNKVLLQMTSSMDKDCSGSNSKIIALTNGTGNNSHTLFLWRKVYELLPVTRRKLLPPRAPVSYTSRQQTGFHASSGMKSEQLMRDKLHIMIFCFFPGRINEKKLKASKSCCQICLELTVIPLLAALRLSCEFALQWVRYSNGT